MDKTALIEGLKQVGRVALFAVVSWLLTVGVIESILVAIFKESMNAGTITLLSGFLTSLLTGIDKALHKAEVGIGGNGLTYF